MCLGLAGLGRIKRGRATNKKTTWAGVVGSRGVLALGIWGMTIVFGAFDQLDEDLNKIDQQMEQELDQ